jgi:hypothetical protein
MQFLAETADFLFFTASRPTVGPTQSIQRVLRALSPRVKQPAHEADHSPPTNAEVNAQSYTSTAPYTFKEWCSIS